MVRSERWRSLAAAALLGLIAPAALAAELLIGPYKHAPLGLDAATQRMATAAGTPLAQALPRGSKLLIWAFAMGECGAERWGDGIDTERFARANVDAFVRAGVDYMVSTGGEAGVFTCASDEGMRRFVARIDSPRLRGIDFDIEGAQTPAQIDDLVARARAVQTRRPALRLSFTLATHGSADGSLRSLNATGETVLAALQRHQLDTAIVNLMVMNYGPADARWCVLRAAAAPPACDMGRSALQAARNVAAKYGIPLARIALTVMPGENDVAGNVTTPADATLLQRGASELGLAGVHWWSLDRDRACPAGAPRVSPLCHGLPGLEDGHFGQLLGAPPATR